MSLERWRRRQELPGPRKGWPRAPRPMRRFRNRRTTGSHQTRMRTETHWHRVLLADCRSQLPPVLRTRTASVRLSWAFARQNRMAKQPHCC